ncbi:MAG: hypothetical protein LAO20_03875 [Acidobacteriia bacterium]|nr:hypothetical protein [Terriglobia bacterium]
MGGNTNRTPQDSDLLVPFEIASISKEYLEYYKIRRNNFFASIQQFPSMWKYFMLLDRIWLRGFEDLNVASAPERMFPLLLYINAHAKLRIAIELAFSGCLAEARSILRDGIEFVAHAHSMLTDPTLQKVWLSKNDGRPDLEAFRDAFERNKKTNAFRGLDELHKAWGDLSETGSHANINALIDRFEIQETATHVEYKIRYTGVAPDFWEKSIFLLLQFCTLMEAILFRDYNTRLNLDVNLVRMREEAALLWADVSKNLIAKHNLKPPPAPLIHMP